MTPLKCTFCNAPMLDGAIACPQCLWLAPGGREKLLEYTTSGLPRLLYLHPGVMPWTDVYTRMLKAYETQLERKGPPPPSPLVLGGWWSSASEKDRRWKEMIAWAHQHGLDHLVALPYDSLIGYGNDVVYDLTGDYYEARDPVPVPPPEQVASAMELLTREWPSLAGPEIAGATRPLRLTGDKKRRLLVEADGAVTPPWGSWTQLTTPTPFRAFRARINALIAPHRLDHIEFLVRHPHEGRFKTPQPPSQT